MNDTPIFQYLNTLSDATRGRVLHVLDRHELAVSELCSVVQLPQSTVSRHLRVLSDEGWVVARAEGTSRLYRMTTRLRSDASRLWEIVGGAVSATPEASQDLERARQALEIRRSRSRRFFATAAAEWDGLRAELFGSRPESSALLSLLDPSWTVGDLGCGTGQLAATLAPYVGRVIAIDESAEMLAAARRRLAGVENVEVRSGRLESLPFAGGELDIAVLSLVLHYIPAPEQAITEAARGLRPGGRLLIVDMQSHGRAEYRERMGHLWQGFTRAQIEGWMRDAGLVPVSYRPLPQEQGAKGPLLLAAVGAVG